MTNKVNMDCTIYKTEKDGKCNCHKKALKFKKDLKIMNRFWKLQSK